MSYEDSRLTASLEPPIRSTLDDTLCAIPQISYKSFSMNSHNTVLTKT